MALLLGASCGVAAAAGAAPLPLLTIGPNTTAWPPPNPNLSFPVGPNPPASSLRRRLQKRLMIPLPDASARSQMLANGLRNVAHSRVEGKPDVSCELPRDATDDLMHTKRVDEKKTTTHFHT